MTSWHLVTFGTAAVMASTTFCVLPFNGLDPHAAMASGTTVGVAVPVAVAVGVAVAVPVGVAVRVPVDVGVEVSVDVRDCASAD